VQPPVLCLLSCTGAHVPSGWPVFACAHERQVPKHDESQQMPSMQLLAAQSLFVVQVFPTPLWALPGAGSSNARHSAEPMRA
jgi:hypothetical protein